MLKCLFFAYSLKKPATFLCSTTCSYHPDQLQAPSPGNPKNPFLRHPVNIAGGGGGGGGVQDQKLGYQLDPTRLNNGYLFDQVIEEWGALFLDKTYLTFRALLHLDA